MKILVIDNSSVLKRGNKFYTNNQNGLFLCDLINCDNKVTYFQFAYETDDSINNFDLNVNGVTYISTKHFGNKLFRYIIAYLSAIPLILNNDFVYLYYPSSFRYLTFLCRLFNKKYGLYIRGEQGITSKVSRYIYKNAFTILTVSDHFTNLVDNVVGKKLANTIRPMITYSDKDIIKDRRYEVKEKYSVLYLGRISRDKGINELLNATRILKDNGYEFEINLVGSGEYYNEASQLIKLLNIEDITFLKGAVYDSEEIKKYYRNSDIYILPTYHEGFPRTLYEAMIFGTPIITTFVGGIPSLMINGYNCKEIKAKTAESVVEGLEFAFKNYHKMIEFAKKGRETVAKIVDSDRPTHAQKLNNILKNDRKNLE